MASCGFYPLIGEPLRVSGLWSALSSLEVFFESLTRATCLAHGDHSQENPSSPSLIARPFIACHPGLHGTLSRQLRGASCIRKPVNLNDFQQEKAQRSAPCQLVPAVYVRLKWGFCFNFLGVRRTALRKMKVALPSLLSPRVGLSWSFSALQMFSVRLSTKDRANDLITNRNFFHVFDAFLRCISRVRFPLFSVIP